MCKGLMLQEPKWKLFIILNGTAGFKDVNKCLNANIYSYLETFGGLSSNLN